MRTALHWRNRNSIKFSRPFFDDRAAQVAEFALSLPLLVVFVVGIYDFSGAVTLKQKLTNAAREGARVAAADPANDLSGASLLMPVSVNDAYQVIDNYLLAEQINDCGLSASPPSTSAPLIWTFSASGNGCPGAGVTVTINRGYYVPQGSTTAASGNCASTAVAANQMAIIGTCVTIQYPYAWKFNSVSSFFGGSFLGPSTITTTAVVFNEN